MVPPSVDSSRAPRRPNGQAAFSRADVLALSAGLLILTMLALPSLAGFRAVGDQQVCAANFRMLTRAWLLYAEDHGGRLPGNLDGGEAQTAQNTNRTWAVGWLDTSILRPDNTNTLLLQNAQLGRYVDSVVVFRCPADVSLSRGRTGEPRVRSVSMNSYVGVRAAPFTAGYRQFATLNSIVDPRPAECRWSSSRNGRTASTTAVSFIEMGSYEPSRPSAYTMVDYPTDRHDGGGTMGMADGHVETWRWVDARTRPALRPGQLLPLNVPHPNSADVARIQRGASRKLD